MAVTIDAATLAPLIGGDPDHAPRVLAVATARVLNYAPDAPDEIHNEAVIRLAGYLAQSDYGGISEETVGPMSVKWPVNHAAMFRNSGAAGLLAAWAGTPGGQRGGDGAVRLPWARVEKRESSYTDTLVDLIVTRASGEKAKATATGGVRGRGRCRGPRVCGRGGDRPCPARPCADALVSRDDRPGADPPGRDRPLDRRP